jgi:hypothetical protein
MGDLDEIQPMRSVSAHTEWAPSAFSRPRQSIGNISMMSVDSLSERPSRPYRLLDLPKDDEAIDDRYAYRMFQFGKQMQDAYLWKPYMDDGQFGARLDTSPLFRRKLISWMGECEQQFDMRHTSLYTAINMLDRFMAVQYENHKDVPRAR